MRLQRSSRSWSIECRIPGNLCDLSKGYFATTFLSSSPPTPATQSGLCGAFICEQRLGRARWRYRPSVAQRVLPNDGADIGIALDHPDLFRQFVEPIDDLGMAFLERARHVGALLEPPVKEVRRQVGLLANRAEHLVAVRKRVAHGVTEHAVEFLESVGPLR